MSVAYWIRRATEADLPEVADLDYEAFSPYGTAESPIVFAALRPLHALHAIPVDADAPGVRRHSHAPT